MIAGVKTKRLKIIPDERGRVMEMLRADDELFEKFGQVYITTAYPSVVKAWHMHKKQSDNLTAIYGMARVALYDGREGSPTRGEVNEFFIGAHNPLLIHIPPQVYHGFKCISDHEVLIINCVTEPYDREHPDEYRIDPYENDIPYDWQRKEG